MRTCRQNTGQKQNKAPCHITTVGPPPRTQSWGGKGGATRKPRYHRPCHCPAQRDRRPGPFSVRSSCLVRLRYDLWESVPTLLMLWLSSPVSCVLAQALRQRNSGIHQVEPENGRNRPWQRRHSQVLRACRMR